MAIFSNLKKQIAALSGLLIFNQVEDVFSHR